MALTGSRYLIATSILIHSIYTKPISVPVVWPDANSNSNFNQDRFSEHRRRIEAINDRPNSDFNRLVFNRVGHNLQSDNSQEYVDFVDKPERLTNNFAAQSSATTHQNNRNDNFVFDDVESRTKFLFKKKIKKKKKKICLPVGYGHGSADRIRTLYDINLIFADVNVNEYDTVGGYGCMPLFGLTGGHGGGHGTQSSHGTHSSHGSHGSHGSNHQTSSHHGSGVSSYVDNTDTDSVIDSDHDYVNQNDHGSLIQTDDYDHESNPSQSNHGSNNLFGGFFHGTTTSDNHGTVSSNNYGTISNNNHGNAHGNGGPLGFFGQGGLFDFSSGNSGGNSGGQRPQYGTLGDSVDDTVKPVIEINVPDTIQDVVQGNWSPGNLVGGIQNSVSGFIQQISDRPGQAIRQINQEISSIFRSFTDLF